MKNIKYLSLSLLASFCLSSVGQAQTYTSADCDRALRPSKLPTASHEEFRDLLVSGESIDKILVSKTHRRVFLIKNGVVAKSYKVAFGLSSAGHKQFEGDNKTPEGLYNIEYKNPKSAYYLSLKVSYPNEQDKAYAQSFGRSAGSDIMIHGLPSRNKTAHNFVSFIHPALDWTNGCIAVDDQDMYEIYSLTKTGTAIEICPYVERFSTPGEN